MNGHGYLVIMSTASGKQVRHVYHWIDDNELAVKNAATVAEGKGYKLVSVQPLGQMLDVVGLLAKHMSPKQFSGTNY